MVLRVVSRLAFKVTHTVYVTLSCLPAVHLLLASTSLQMNGHFLSHCGFERRGRLGVIKALCGVNS